MGNKKRAEDKILDKNLILLVKLKESTMCLSQFTAKMKF